MRKFLNEPFVHINNIHIVMIIAFVVLLSGFGISGWIVYPLFAGAVIWWEISNGRHERREQDKENHPSNW